MTTRRCLLCAAALAAGATATAAADVVTVLANRDTTIYSESASLSNGAGKYFFSGRTNASNLRRGLVAFDTSGIPPGSTVTSASMQLYMSRTQAANEAVALRRLLADWGEGLSDAPGQEGAGDPAENGDATWVYTFYNTANPPASPAWSSPGGDFAPGASATTVVGVEGFYTWGSTAQMVADVQGWVDDPSTSFGWILLGDEGQDQTAKRFDSRESTNSSHRPRLTVTFTPPAVSGACCFPDGTCLDLGITDCNGQGGTFQGTSTECVAVTCLVIQGACCFDNSTCLLLAAGQCAAQGGTYQGDGTACTAGLCPLVLTPYLDALPIPGVLQPVAGQPGGEATYEVEMTQLQQQLHQELPPTTVWGYGGSYPGPTVEAWRDSPVTVTYINSLPATHHLPVDTCMDGAVDNASRTVPHLHGGHVPPEYDGYPESWILPGQQVTYVYPNNQLPATLWFHDHALGITRLNVYMGLAAFYLIRDQVELDLDLPAGEFEIPLVIQDRLFNADGSLMYHHPWQDHFFGDKILVNGKVWPYLDVKQARYRFRILNGSNSRTYRLALSPYMPFHLIGTDNGLLPQTLTVNELLLAPAERADVIIDFSTLAAGTEIFLSNSAPAPFPGDPGVGVVPQVMKFNVLNQAGQTPQVPSQLRPFEVIPEQEAVRTRTFELRKLQGGCAGFMWLINALHWNDVTEYPRLGQTEIWSFINHSGVIHPMHMHLVSMQVLDRQDFEVVNEQVVPIGEPVQPDPTEEGWKDTVRANPQQITRIIARFRDYEGLYPYHCHILEHEDNEMMRQFLTLPPCPWDLDFDDLVGVTDLLEVLALWGTDPGGLPDFDGNGAVDVTDLLDVLGHWGPCP